MNKKLLVIFFLILFSALLFIVNKNSSKILTSSISGVSSKFLFNEDAITSFDDIVESVKNRPGTYSVYIKDVNTLKTYEYNASEQYYAASLFKLPIGVAFIKQIELGNLDLDTIFNYQPRHYTDGTGVINQAEYGTEYTLDQLLTNLFKHSDNVAQTMLLEHLNVNSNEIKTSFPLEGTTNYYNINESNVKEIGEFLEYVYYSDYLNAKSKMYLLSLMTNTSFDSWLADSLEDSFAHKIGSWGNPPSWHDCGILSDSKVIICIMSKDTTFESFLGVTKNISSFVNTQLIIQ